MIKRKRKYLTVKDVKGEVDKLRAEMEERFASLKEARNERRNQAVEAAEELLAGPPKGKHFSTLVLDDIGQRERDVLTRALQYDSRDLRCGGDGSFKVFISTLYMGDEHFSTFEPQQVQWGTAYRAISSAFSSVGKRIANTRNGGPAVRAFRLQVHNTKTGHIVWQHGPIWCEPQREKPYFKRCEFNRGR